MDGGPQGHVRKWPHECVSLLGRQEGGPWASGQAARVCRRGLSGMRFELGLSWPDGGHGRGGQGLLGRGGLRRSPVPLPALRDALGWNALDVWKSLDRPHHRLECSLSSSDSESSGVTEPYGISEEKEGICK